jgi:hypothetical protein
MQFGGNKESSQFLGAHDMGLRARLLEGVAGGDGAILEAALKPLHALGGTSVGETLRIHTSAGHALQTVVTHCGRGLQAFIDVSGFQDITLLGGVTPAKQSACSSRRTESWLAACGFCCCAARTLPSMPSNFCT